LYGLVRYTAEKRTKEIGIRKVFGASTNDILFYFSRELIILISIAFLIAWPIAYLIMDNWLIQFAYKISLGPDIFVFSGIIICVLALTTIYSQIIKSASKNPVDSLRYE
jgi:putative ABC transport system permease protein